MSENNKESLVQDVLDRIEELNKNRVLLESKQNEVDVHEKDLNAIEKIKGSNSDEYNVKKEILESSKQELSELKKEVDRLVFKRSELKPVLDEVSKIFENELKAEQEREFPFEIGPRPKSDDVDESGNVRQLTREEQNVGRKTFKTLLEYLNKDVVWNAKTVVGLMVLIRNMDENKEWTRSADFDNIIKLRSSNILVLYKTLTEDLTGKGFFEGKEFLQCWTNCGKGISDAVNEIKRLHEQVRITGTKLNTIEDEFLNSVDDIQDKTVTTQEEVAPEV